jgi:diphosphomevalonate decarboxylase
MASQNVRFVTARTGPNIAVIKYWGKRDSGPLNLATNDSISLAIDNTDLCSQTSAGTSPDFEADRLWLNGAEQDLAKSKRIRTVLTEVRQRCKDEALRAQKIHVVSRNSFPTAAGLASSAAGLAALTVALAALLGVEDSYPGELTTIARMGSGSACRSLVGGLVQWHCGTSEDGADSIATQEAPADYWALDLTILVANAAKKHTSSTAGMQDSIRTSALFAHRVANVVPDRMKRIKQVGVVGGWVGGGVICVGRGGWWWLWWWW